MTDCLTFLLPCLLCQGWLYSQKASQNIFLPHGVSWQAYYHSSRKITSVPPIVRWRSNMWTGEGEEGQFNYLHRGSFSSPRTDLRVEIPRPATLIWILLPLFSPWVIFEQITPTICFIFAFWGDFNGVYTSQATQGLIKILKTTQGLPSQQVWVETWEFAFQTSSQVVAMLLLERPTFREPLSYRKILVFISYSCHWNGYMSVRAQCSGQGLTLPLIIVK